MRGLCPCIRLKRPVDPSAIRPNRNERRCYNRPPADGGVRRFFV